LREWIVRGVDDEDTESEEVLKVTSEIREWVADGNEERWVVVVLARGL